MRIGPTSRRRTGTGTRLVPNRRELQRRRGGRIGSTNSEQDSFLIEEKYGDDNIKKIVYPDLTISPTRNFSNFGNETSRHDTFKKIVLPNITESFNNTQWTNDVPDVIFSSPESSSQSNEDEEAFYTRFVTKK